MSTTSFTLDDAPSGAPSPPPANSSPPRRSVAFAGGRSHSPATTSFQLDDDEADEDFFLDDDDYDGIETFGNLDDIIDTAPPRRTDGAADDDDDGGDSGAADDQGELFEMVRARLKSTALGSRGTTFDDLFGHHHRSGTHHLGSSSGSASPAPRRGPGGSLSGVRTSMSIGATTATSDTDTAPTDSQSTTVSNRLRMSLAGSRSRSRGVSMMGSTFNRKRLKSVIHRVAMSTMLATSASRRDRDDERTAEVILKRIITRYDDPIDILSVLSTPTVICVRSPVRVPEFVKAGMLDVMITVMEKYPDPIRHRQILEGASASLLLCISRCRVSPEQLERIVSIRPFSRGVIEVLSEVACYYPEMFDIQNHSSAASGGDHSPFSPSAGPDHSMRLSFEETKVPDIAVSANDGGQKLVGAVSLVDSTFVSKLILSVIEGINGMLDAYPPSFGLAASPSRAAGKPGTTSPEGTAAASSSTAPAVESSVQNPLTNSVPSIVRFTDFILRVENVAPAAVQRSLWGCVLRALATPYRRLFQLPLDKQATVATMLERTIENCVLGDDPIHIDFTDTLVAVLLHYLTLPDDQDAMLSACAMFKRIMGQVITDDTSTMTAGTMIPSAAASTAADGDHQSSAAATATNVERELRRRLALSLDAVLAPRNGDDENELSSSAGGGAAAPVDPVAEAVRDRNRLRIGMRGLIAEWVSQTPEVRDTLLLLVEAVSRSVTQVRDSGGNDDDEAASSLVDDGAAKTQTHPASELGTSSVTSSTNAPQHARNARLGAAANKPMLSFTFAAAAVASFDWLLPMVAEGCRRAYRGIADAPATALASWASALVTLSLHASEQHVPSMNVPGGFSGAGNSGTVAGGANTNNFSQSIHDAPLTALGALVLLAAEASRKQHWLVVQSAVTQLNRASDAVTPAVLVDCVAQGLLDAPPSNSASASSSSGTTDSSSMLAQMLGVLRAAVTPPTTAVGAAMRNSEHRAGGAVSTVVASLAKLIEMIGAFPASIGGLAASSAGDAASPLTPVVSTGRLTPSPSAAEMMATNAPVVAASGILDDIVAVAAITDSTTGALDTATRASLLRAARNVIEAVSGLRGASLKALSAAAGLLPTLAQAEAGPVVESAAQLALRCQRKAVVASRLLASLLQGIAACHGAQAVAVLQLLASGAGDAAWTSALVDAHATSHILLFASMSAVSQPVACRIAHVLALCTPDEATASTLRGNAVVAHLLETETSATGRMNPLSTDARADVERLRELLRSADEVANKELSQLRELVAMMTVQRDDARAEAQQAEAKARETEAAVQAKMQEQAAADAARIAQLEGEITGVKQAQASERESNERELARLQGDLDRARQEAEDARGQRAEQNSAADDDIRQLREDVRSADHDRRRAEERHEKDMDRVNAGHRTEVDRIKEQHAADLARERDEFERRVARTTENAEKACDAAEKRAAAAEAATADAEARLRDEKANVKDLEQQQQQQQQVATVAADKGKAQKRRGKSGKASSRSASAVTTPRGEGDAPSAAVAVDGQHADPMAARTAADSPPRRTTPRRTPRGSGVAARRAAAAAAAAAETARAAEHEEASATLRRRNAVLEERVQELQAELNDARRKLRVLEEAAEEQIQHNKAAAAGSTTDRSRQPSPRTPSPSRAGGAAHQHPSDTNNNSSQQQQHEPSFYMPRTDFVEELHSLERRFEKADMSELDRMRVAASKAIASLERERLGFERESEEATKLIDKLRHHLASVTDEVCNLRAKADSYATLHEEYTSLARRFERTTQQRKRDADEVAQVDDDDGDSGGEPHHHHHQHQYSAAKTVKRLSIALARICDLEKEVKAAKEEHAMLRLATIKAERKAKLEVMMQQHSDITLPWARSRIRRLEREMATLRAALRDSEARSSEYKQRCDSELLVETDKLQRRVAEADHDRASATAEAADLRTQVTTLHSEIARRENVIAQLRQARLGGNSATIYVVDSTNQPNVAPPSARPQSARPKSAAAAGGYDASQDPHLAQYFAAGNARAAVRRARSKAPTQAVSRFGGRFDY